MKSTTANFLTKKCIESIKFYKPQIKIFDTALDMLKFHWPDNYIGQIKYYESYMSKSNYVSNSHLLDGSHKFYKNVYTQPSLQGISRMKLFGLATQPEISVTHEGQSMRDFTFTIFHEIGHIYYDTLNEEVANLFAVLYNKILWEPKA